MNLIQIDLFTHSGCPGGEAARRYLEAAGLPFQVRDVLESAEALAEFQVLGGIGTPLLVVGGQVMHGFDPAAFERLRAAASRRSHQSRGEGAVRG